MAVQNQPSSFKPIFTISEIPPKTFRKITMEIQKGQFQAPNIADSMKTMKAIARQQSGRYISIGIKRLKEILGTGKTLLYIGSADDIWRPLLLTDATTVVLADITNEKNSILKKLQTEHTLLDKLQILSPWRKIRDGEYKLDLNFRGQKRTIIFAVGDVTKTLPSSVANGYDILLTAVSDMILFQDDKAFNNIFGPLNNKGHYLAHRLVTEGLEPAAFGFIPVARIDDFSDADPRIPLSLPCFMDYHLVRKIPIPSLSKDIFIEWNLIHSLEHASSYHLNGLADCTQQVLQAKLKVESRGEEIATDEAYNTARHNFNYSLHSVLEYIEHIREFESVKKQRSYAQKMVPFSPTHTSAKTEAQVKEVIRFIHGENSAKSLELIIKIEACFKDLRTILA